MKQQLRGKELFLVGVTLFSMFFGAGNLIFPPFVGYQAGAAALPAFLGMALTAVCFPVLGVVAVAKVGGTDKLCSKIHPYFAIVFTILVYLCIGPMLAIPRTASTSYSMFAFLTARLDGMTLAGIPIDWVLRTVFSLAFFAGAYQLAKRPAHFKDVLGKWMTPVLLVMIVVMFAAGLFYLKDVPAAPQQAYADGAFMKGFVEGYNTMDTLAAIVFGIVIALNVQACGVSEKKAVARSIMNAGVIAGVFCSQCTACWPGWARAAALCWRRQQTARPCYPAYACSFLARWAPCCWQPSSLWHALMCARGFYPAVRPFSMKNSLAFLSFAGCRRSPW